MMPVLPIFLALGLVSAPAHAKGKKKKDDGIGLRMKVSTDLMSLQTTQINYDGTDVDNGDTRTTSIGFFDGIPGGGSPGPRLEGTYTFIKNVEAGLILGYGQSRGTSGDQEIPLSRNAQIGLTGAYNFGLGSGFQAFGQPILLLDSSTSDVSEETETRVRATMVGADIGVRWKAMKRVTLDAAAEGLFGRARVTVNDESDDKLYVKVRAFGIRTGVSVKF